ncbi:hypothetical protein [Porcipelethomonas sp.]|uniref:hypothetical protein n=1 Tax=Porcipelethomonas sp. TaxID=2981675 RepID=UPI003EF3404C
MDSNNKDKLEKLNKFTRRNLSEDEVYIFDVVLCDNEVDRDCECFSVKALEKLKELFVGKTGIFDHNPKSSGQTARIFDTQISEDPNRKTSRGEIYTCLKGSAYMVRTAANEDLIKEIDGGIKKEVSISCSAASRKCSVCGQNRLSKSCPHKKGKEYGGKKACIILDDITDAYEWSFVAVPAQINAGVTKKSYGQPEYESGGEINGCDNETVEKLCDNLKKDVSRLCFLAGENYKLLKSAADKMSVSELLEFKSELEKKCRKNPVPDILSGDEEESLKSFRM